MTERSAKPSKNDKTENFLTELSLKSERLMREALVRRPYHGLFKDLELSRSQFLTLYLIFMSFASVLMIDVFLSLDFDSQTTRSELDSGQIPLPPSFFIILGLIIGVIVGGFLLDRIRGRRYPVLDKFLIVSILMTSSHIGFFRRTGDIVPKILFLGNSFIAGVLFMFFLTFFIDFTTILEKGRVFAYLIILLGISLGFLIFVIAVWDFLMFLPVIFLISASVYLYKNREKEEPYKPIERDEGSHLAINFDVVKYISLLSLFALTIGLFTPSTQVQNLGTGDWSTNEIVIAIISGLVVSVITATAVGMIFDFFGRKSSIANIILAVSIINFIRLFNVNIPYFDLTVIFGAFLASFMSVPLLISDITSRENLGKVLALTFTLTLFSVVMGIAFGFIIIDFMPDFFQSDYTAEIFLVGIVNFVAILSLFFLVNMKETLSSKEQNWPDKLIHLYVIHESGVLLYEHSFIDEELLEADLISGGFVGLIALLQEITQEEQKLKSIDHGGKRILFGFNSERTIIYALIVSEELIILRNKFHYFIQEIEENYQIRLEDFSGVDSELWKNRLKPIMEKHFQRKYFELIPDMVNIGNKRKIE